VTGNITATERVDIRDAGSVDGDLSAPRVAIADGAHFRGAIDMQKGGAPKAAGDGKAADVKPATPPSTTPASTSTPAVPVTPGVR
jgi:cytoskeletal protein CcmA (bactofilin family)